MVMGRLGGFHRAWSRRDPTDEELAGDPGFRDLLAVEWTVPQAAALKALEENDLVVYSGGNFGGKTMLAVALAVGAALGLYEWCPLPADIVLVGLAKTQARASLERYLKRFIPRVSVRKQTQRESLTEVTEFYTGSMLTVQTNAQGALLGQGGRRSLIVYDEQPLIPVFEEGLFRLREDMDSRILITMTPTQEGAGGSWVYRELVQKAVEKRVRLVSGSMFENGVPPCRTCGHDRGYWDERLRGLGIRRATEAADAMCVRCRTFGVEPRVSQSKVDSIERRVSDPRKRMMRFHGAFMSSGESTSFSQEECEALLRGVREPKRMVGSRLVYSEPIPGHLYGIGVDASRGRGQDESVIQVVDADAGELVLTWANADIAWTSWIWDLIEIAVAYNDGLCCIEWASGGEGVLPMLMENGRVRLYRRRRFERQYVGAPSLDSDVGYQPGERAREQVLTNLIGALRIGLRLGSGRAMPSEALAGGLRVADRGTVGQVMLSYYDNRKGKLVLPAAEHDDRFIALALAWEAARCERGSIGESDGAGGAEEAVGPSRMDQFFEQLRRRASRPMHPFDRARGS